MLSSFAASLASFVAIIVHFLLFPECAFSTSHSFLQHTSLET